LAKKRAELEPSPAKNVRAQLNATKRNSTALYASPSHKNVHTTLKQKGPYNNLAAQLAEIPVRKRIGVKGELARIKEMARKLQQERNNAALAASLAEAPAPAPPRSMSPGEKAAIQEVANAQKAAAASMRPSSSRGRTNTRRVPKTPSPSPGAKAAIQEVANAQKAAAASMRPSSSRGRTETRRAPKTPSPSPGAKAAIQEVANAQKAAVMRPSPMRASPMRASAPPVPASRGRTETRRAPKTPSPSPGAKAAIQEVENAKKAATKTPSILQSALAKLLGKKSKK